MGILPDNPHEVNEQAVLAIGAIPRQTSTTTDCFRETVQNSHRGDRTVGDDDDDRQCHHEGCCRVDCCSRAHRTREDLMNKIWTLSHDLFSRWQEVFRGIHQITFFQFYKHSASKSPPFCNIYLYKFLVA